MPNTAASLDAVATANLSTGKKLIKHFITSEGLGSDSTHLLYFGLGKDDGVDSVDIQYLKGPVQTIVNPAINSVVEVNR